MSKKREMASIRISNTYGSSYIDSYLTHRSFINSHVVAEIMLDTFSDVANRKEIELSKKWSIWSEILPIVPLNNLDEEIPKIFDGVALIIDKANEVDSEIFFLFENIKRKYFDYVESSLEDWAIPSKKSLIQIFRYFPAIYKEKPDFYLDSETGFFGFTITKNLNSKRILNILVKDNCEVNYSCIKFKNNEFVKFSGRAYMTKKIENSMEIDKILNMMYDYI